MLFIRPDTPAPPEPRRHGKVRRHLPTRAELAQRARLARARLAAAWRHPRERPLVLAMAALLLASCGTGGVVAAWTRACAGTCPTAEQVGDYAPRQASVVLDARGGVLGSFYRERRTVVGLKGLPRYVPLAFVAIEDRRFFEHEGVDPVRMVGAVRDNIVNGWGGPGGSTITMQLARNLFPQQLPASEKTLRRKIAEVKLALDIERHYSKSRILEMYVNTVYLGAGAYGIEAAARTYFGKAASQLDYVQAATLAGLAQAPTAYNPRQHADRAQRRRDRVLNAMAEAGLITPAQAQQGIARPVSVVPPTGAVRAPYFVERVRHEMEERFGELLYTGGLRIHTALDPELQAAAEAALEADLRSVERGDFGPFDRPTYERFTAGLHPGQAIPVTPYLQGLVVAMDPGTGAILSMVGGRDFRQSQFNRATSALRQPGSAFKPFVYGAALEKGRSPNSGVEDEPLSIPMGDGTVWSPKNYDGRYSGWTTLRSALMHSRNTAAIRLGREVGIAAVRGVAQRAGIGTPIPAYPSVYIGSAGVYPLDLVAAYAAFGNGGYRVEPRYVLRVEDHQGRPLWTPDEEPHPALDPAVAWLLTDMLRGVVDHGTGYPARDPEVGGLSYDIPAAGKTGTTNDGTDVWFVGYTPQVLAGVWIGFDSPQPIIHGATGGTLAVPVWARLMRTFYAARKPPEPWKRPEGVVAMRLLAGHPAPASCAWAGDYDLFAARFAPEPSCEPPASLPERDVDPTLLGTPVVPEVPGPAPGPNPTPPPADRPPPA
jgi:penicillin-binding protein 1A